MTDQQSNPTGGSEPTPPTDPTAINPAAEVAFAAVGDKWLAAFDAVGAYLEAAARAAKVAGAGDPEQRDAIAVAAQRIGVAVDLAYRAATEAIGRSR